MPSHPIRPLIVALGVAAAPLVFELPWWSLLWCAAFWGGVLIRQAASWQTPSRATRMIIFSIGLGLVILEAGMRFDGGDFIALLAVMAGVKPLEVRSRRDSMVTVFLAYFLVITSLFVFENLAMVVYLFVSVWVTTAVLIHVHDPDGALGSQMKLSARLVAMALPLAMLLFIAFPRISGSILGVPWSRQSRSGFSSVMRMGDVSRLVVTDTPVFSVSFQSPLPEAGQRYWRGIVFQSFDGDTWQPARHQTVRREAIQGKALVRYRVILEPHGYRNLFVLDLPQSATPVARIMDDHTLIAPHPVLQRLTYDATSIVDYRRAGSEYSADRYLQLPPNRNGQTVALGRRLARTHVDPADRVEAGMNIFKNQGFSYTLRPDRLGRDAVDDFLFVSRKGFCEHFASAFTVLMRSAGVPTRMVAGYQGGRWNTWGDFLTVRQADAHVWCEVWLRGQGWVRVDPTFEVAPDRIEAGIDHVLGSLPWLANTGRDHLLSRWIERARLAWEVVNIRWNMWFMGFSAEDQAVLLKNLWHRGQWLLLAVGACVAVVILSRLHRRQRSRQPMTTEQKALIIYNHFLKKLSRVGLVKPSYQGAWHHCQTVARQHPALEREIGAIVGLYLALRYGRKPDDDRLKVLRRLVRRFHPRKLVKREQ